MSHGAGKYDLDATILRNRTGGRAVLLVVLGGDAGDGFSVQAEDAADLSKLPIVLRQVADAIEKDVQS